MLELLGVSDTLCLKNGVIPDNSIISPFLEATKLQAGHNHCHSWHLVAYLVGTAVLSGWVSSSGFSLRCGGSGKEKGPNPEETSMEMTVES